MSKTKYIAYYRVSTDDQGKSGLGLQAQRDFVRGYIEDNGEMALEFQDIETGKSDSRKGLLGAIKECKSIGAILVAYDITRISRGGFGVMARIEESGVKFIAAIDPNDSDFVKAIKFAVAKEEADRISRNTKKALQVIKDKLSKGERHISKSGNIVTRLGSPSSISREAIEKSAKVRSERAISNSDNKRAGALILSMRNEGGKSFYAITQALNASGFKTSKGNDFSQVQVKRLYQRYSV